MIWLCCVGKFKLHSKRQDLLIKAAALLKDKVRINIAFAGDGPELVRMQELAKSECVQDQMVFLG